MVERDAYVNAHMDERRRMKEASRHQKNGDWVIVVYPEEYDDGLQGWGYESEKEAIHKMKEIMDTDEYRGVEHEVMTKEEFEKQFDRDTPW